jgi:hypothetical protein
MQVRLLRLEDQPCELAVLIFSPRDAGADPACAQPPQWTPRPKPHGPQSLGELLPQLLGLGLQLAPVELSQSARIGALRSSRGALLFEHLPFEQLRVTFVASDLFPAILQGSRLLGLGIDRGLAGLGIEWRRTRQFAKERPRLAEIAFGPLEIALLAEQLRGLDL